MNKIVSEVKNSGILYYPRCFCGTLGKISGLVLVLLGITFNLDIKIPIGKLISKKNIEISQNLPEIKYRICKKGSYQEWKNIYLFEKQDPYLTAGIK